MKRLFIKTFAAAIAIFALGLGTASAQVNEYTFDLKSFSGITASNDFQVTVLRGNAYSVKLIVNEAYRDYVSASVAGDDLQITFDEKKVPSEIKKTFRGKDAPAQVFRAVVTMPGGLQTINLSDKANLMDCPDAVLDTTSVNITLADNAEIKPLNIYATRVNITLSKKTTASFTVDADAINASLSGSSALTLTQNSNSLDVAMSSNSSIVVNGETQALSINTKNTAKAILNGSAPTANYVMAGSSDVNAINLSCTDAVVDMTSICKLQEAATGTLYITMSNGSSLTYANSPEIHIRNIKNSSVAPYGASTSRK